MDGRKGARRKVGQSLARLANTHTRARVCVCEAALILLQLHKISKSLFYLYRCDYG
jgi:hypothetical protein